MDSANQPGKGDAKPFSARRRQVLERRRARRSRKKMSEGLELIFGHGAEMMAVFVTVILFVFGLWSWWQSESKNRVYVAPTVSDWKVMNLAVARRNPELCDRINESAAEKAPSGATAFTVHTFRDECRERILAKKKPKPRAASQPSDNFWPSEPANPVAWDRYKPKKLKEYDRLGEILQSPEPADELGQGVTSAANELPRLSRPESAAPINSGFNDQQRLQPQSSPIDSQRQLSR